MARAHGTGSDDPGDLLSSAAAELYAADPDQFTARRKELATSARKAGDAAAARAIGALAKPTRSAWVVNKLVRADPSVAGRLADLGGQLRAGEAALDGASIRELSRARRDLITALVRQALAEAGQNSPSVALRDEVTDTFSAALADPDVAGQVAAGTLTKAAHWAGFGLGIGLAAPPAGDSGKPPGSAGGAASKSGPRPAARERGKTPGAAAPAAERMAERAAQRERAHQEALARAEQAALEAAQAAAAATATEREVAQSVRFMEERLNRERQRLIAARRDARQAVATAERANANLDRLRH